MCAAVHPRGLGDSIILADGPGSIAAFQEPEAVFMCSKKDTASGTAAANVATP